MKKKAASVLAAAGAREQAEIMGMNMLPVSHPDRATAGDTEAGLPVEEISVPCSKDMLTDCMWAVCQISGETFPKTGKTFAAWRKNQPYA